MGIEVIILSNGLKDWKKDKKIYCLKKEHLILRGGSSAPNKPPNLGDYLSFKIPSYTPVNCINIHTSSSLHILLHIAKQKFGKL